MHFLVFISLMMSANSFSVIAPSILPSGSQRTNCSWASFSALASFSFLASTAGAALALGLGDAARFTAAFLGAIGSEGGEGRGGRENLCSDAPLEPKWLE